MNKELEALETIKNIGLSHFSYDRDENLDGEWEYTPVDVDDGTIEENYPEEIKIIETALKDYENLQLKHRSMTEQVFNDFKKLKALELIKEKKINVRFLIGCKNLKEYNDVISDHLAQEEFDLLKKELL